MKLDFSGFIRICLVFKDILNTRKELTCAAGSYVWEMEWAYSVLRATIRFLNGSNFAIIIDKYERRKENKNSLQLDSEL